MLGTVKWFNVRNMKGFMHRYDTHEAIFVYQTAVTPNKPHKVKWSMGESETVRFDIIVFRKGQEAASVTRPDG